MMFSSDELEILEYLKSWEGKAVSMVEICRCAGGRKRFREEPHWAKNVMARLVDAKLVQVNERGHYQFISEAEKKSPGAQPCPAPAHQSLEQRSAAALKVAGGEHFFPPPKPKPEKKTGRWVSPQIKAILHRAGKWVDDRRAGE